MSISHFTDVQRAAIGFKENTPRDDRVLPLIHLVGAIIAPVLLGALVVYGLMEYR